LRIAQSKGVHQVTCFSAENGNTTGFQNIVLLQKITQWTAPPKNKIVSGNFSHAVFSHLDFLTHENGIDRLSQNVGTELPFIVV